MRVPRDLLLCRSGLSPEHVDEIVLNLNVTFRNDTVDSLIAVAMQRFVSDEAYGLFNSTEDFSAREVLYAHEVSVSLFDADDLAGEWKLDLKDFDLHQKGRVMVQAESTIDFQQKYGITLSTESSSVMVLIRQRDTSYECALRDAYLFGDGRLKHAALSLMRERIPSLAVP